MNAKADGTWGYSNPNDEHIIFCVDPEYYTMFRAQFASLIVAEGTGMWEGEVEPCFAMTLENFRRVWRNHPYLFAKQKSFCISDILKRAIGARQEVSAISPHTHQKKLVRGWKSQKMWLSLKQGGASLTIGGTR